MRSECLRACFLVGVAASSAAASPGLPGEPGLADAGALGATAADDVPADQGVGASLGIASGGRVTPGGLRVAGHYLYQLSDRDWFDGIAAFTFGGGAAGCATDGMAPLACQHGFTSGNGVEIAATVRRLFAPQGAFRPFARAGLGISIVRFGADEVAGVAVPLRLGAGVRARVAPRVAVVTQADVQVGLGGFNRGLGLEPQLGLALTAGAEFELR